MSRSRTPKQIHDDAQQATTGYQRTQNTVQSTYLKGYRGSDFRSLDRFGFEESINGVLLNFDEVNSKVAQLLAEEDETLQEIGSLRVIKSIIASMDTYPVNSQIVMTFQKLTTKDPALARALYQIANRSGTDANKERDEEVEHLKELINDFDMSKKLTENVELKSTLRDLRWSSEGLNEAVVRQARIIEESNLRIIQLESELRTRPERLEDDTVREEEIRKVMDEYQQVNDADATKRFSEIRELVTSQQQANIDVLTKKLADYTELVTQAEENRRKAVDQLQKEQGQNSSLRKIVEEKLERIDKTEEELQTTKQHVQLCEMERQTDKRFIDKMRDDIKDLRADARVTSQELNSLQARNEALQKGSDSRDGTIDKLRDDLAEANIAKAVDTVIHSSDVEEMKKRIEEEAALVQRRETSIKNLEESKAALETDLELVRQENESNKQAAIEATKQSVSYQAEAESLRERIKVANETTVQLQIKITADDAELRREIEKTTSMSQRAQALAAEIEKLKALMSTTDSEHMTRVADLQKLLSDAAESRKQRDENLSREVAAAKAEVSRVFAEGEKKENRLRLQKEELERNESGLNVQLQSLRHDHDILKANFTSTSLEASMLRKDFDRITVTADEREAVIERLREKVTGGVAVSAELDMVRAELERCHRDRDVDREEMKTLESDINVFKSIIIRYGHGGENQDVDLTIIEKLRQLSPISEADFRRRCDVWEDACQYRLPFEHVTAVELWIMSIIRPFELTLAVLNGFVKSRPSSGQLPFLEAALFNAVKHVSDITTFEQSMFILRGLELLWMTWPDVSHLHELLLDVERRLWDSPLVSGYCTWLTRVLTGGSASRGAQVRLSVAPKLLKVNDRTHMFMDELLVIIQNGTVTLMPKTALKISGEDIYWLIEATGYPTQENPFVTRVEFTVDNLTMLGDALGEL